MNAITFLGTGNAMCTRCYNTCFYIRSNGGGMLVDADGGNGIFRQLHKAHITYEEIRHIFVTHVHTDHILGVVWLIRKFHHSSTKVNTRANSSFTATAK